MAFTEPQVYHLIRVLADETLSRSFSTMERMVVDASRGNPTVAPSRTAHFYSGRRAQTPGPGNDGDSSGSETESEAVLVAKDSELSSSGETGDSSYYEESDSATEMALISKSFKKTADTQGTSLPKTPISNAPGESGTGTLEYSRQDATLLEVRDQARDTPTAGPSKSKKTKGNKKLSRRGVPMREEFFSKIGWTRSSFLGPLTHSIIPIWFGVTSARRTFPLGRKALTKYLDTIVLNVICARISDGVMNI